MVKQAVRVVVRTRPTANFASKNLTIDPQSGTVTVNIPKPTDKGLINNQQESWKFKFDKILHNASQEDVYDQTAREIVTSVVDGYNGTILCYGQTGAGKTFSMSGSTQNYKYRGIVPRAISHVFQEIGARFEQAVTVRVSYVEIYNEMMFDLLSGIPTHEQTGNISIQDDSKGGIIVKGLSQCICTNEEEALNYLFEGETNRTISEHQLNKASSRSHCVFTIHLESKSRVESSEKIVISKLNLVDLAGSERTKKTGSEGLTLKEASYINKSLSFLEQVVVALCDRHRDHVPYRQSKMTNILKDSLGGNCKTLMVSNIWPEPEHLEETVSTLKFATRMMRVSNEATINVQLDPTLLIKKYEKEIRDLKQELAMHDTLANRGRITYDQYSPEEQYELQKTAEKFLEGEIEEIEVIDSLRQVRELFHQFRYIYKKLKKQVVDGISTQKRPLEGQAKGQLQIDPTRQKNASKNEGGVGEPEEKKGFGIGLAPKDSKPANKIDLTRTKEREDTNEEEDEGLENEEKGNESVHASMKSIAKKGKKEKREFMDRQTAFTEYKKDEGKKFEEAILQNRDDMNEKKAIVKKSTDTCNATKKEIDSIKNLLDEKREQKRSEPGGEEDVIDEEEYGYIKKLKELKRMYRESFEVLKSTKSELLIIQQNMDQLKQQLVYSFEEWYAQNIEEPQAQDEQPNIDENDKKFTTVSQEEEVDPDALAYIRAKQNVKTLVKARKYNK